MRFSTISVAFCLVAGVFALPAAPGADPASAGAAAKAPGGGLPASLPVGGSPAGLAQAVGPLAGTLKGVVSGGVGGVGTAPSKRGLLGGGPLGDGCSECDDHRPDHKPSPAVPGGRRPCSDDHRCPVGPSEPTDCVGIIQSLLRELYPTVDFVAEELDEIVASILRIVGANDLSRAFLHGRIGLLNDLLALLGCTIDQLVFAIEQVVSGLAH